MSSAWLLDGTAWLLDSTTRAACAIGIALLVDALLGDPVFNWHPVRLIGRLAEAMEGFCRHLSGLGLPSDASETQALPPGTRVDPKTVTAGALAWALTFGLSAGLALTVSRLAGIIHPVFGLAIDGAIVWASIAPGDLAAHALRVKRALERDRREQSIPSMQSTPIGQALVQAGPIHGREAVAMIVGRDVSVLDEAGVARACIESVAESSIDGAAAPLFWAALLGPWAALAYRCVNTMDSMFGHRNARYFSFGLVAARADDLANWIPARLSSTLACLLAPIAGGSMMGAFTSFFLYRRSHASPNAGHPEAAYAGAFGLLLGGPIRYTEGLSEKPWMNPDGQDAGIVDIQKAVSLMYIQTLVSAMAFLACRLALVELLQKIQTGI